VVAKVTLGQAFSEYFTPFIISLVYHQALVQQTIHGLSTKGLGLATP
jgi:hypothetical protein